MRLARVSAAIGTALLVPVMLATPASAATNLPVTATLTLSVSQVGFDQWVDWQITGCTGLGNQVKATVHWTNRLESWEMTDASGVASGQTKFENGFGFSGPVRMTVRGSCDVLGSYRYVAKKASKPLAFVVTDGSKSPAKTTPWKPTQEEWVDATLSKAKAKPGKKVTVSSGGFSPKEKVTVTLAGNMSKSYGNVKADKNGMAELKITIPEKATPGKYTITMTGKGKLLIAEATLKVKKKK